MILRFTMSRRSVLTVLLLGRGRGINSRDTTVGSRLPARFVLCRERQLERHHWVRNYVGTDRGLFITPLTVQSVLPRQNVVSHAYVSTLFRSIIVEFVKIQDMLVVYRL